MQCRELDRNQLPPYRVCFLQVVRKDYRLREVWKYLAVRSRTDNLRSDGR